MELAQIPLSFGLRDDATFASFYSGANEEIKCYINRMAQGAGEQFSYIYGAEGSGKTHLLHAACNLAYQYNQSAVYLALADFENLTTDTLSGLDNIDLVCLDDVDSIAQHSAWEEAVFHLYNRLKDSSGKLLISAKESPKNVAIQLADLKSRLAWGVACQLKPLDEEQMLVAIKARAQARGINLEDVVGRFLLRRFPRNMTKLFAVLEELDQASLTAKRRLTIPFVKEVLGV